jgi:uncharacterized cupredoxin-like copper-binding protein
MVGEDEMNKWRYSFAGGALVGGVGVAALLLGLPGVQADAGRVAVHAVDYGYQGVPRTLPAGETRFSFTNDSQAESHEMTLFRINDGVNESFDQILAEDEAQQNKDQTAQPSGGQPSGGQQGGGQNPPATQSPPPAPKMSFFASTGSAPGQSARMDLIGNLPAGRYGMVCFLPVANDEAGTPHYKKGMKAEFTVQ